MTANPHIDRLREALDAICRDSLEKTLAEVESDLEFHAEYEISSLFVDALAALDVLAADLDAAIRERDEARNLASLVSGVLCDAGTIVVAATDDVKGLHEGLRELLEQRDEARGHLTRAGWADVLARMESAEARVAELERERDEAREEIVQATDWFAAHMREAEARVAELEAALRFYANEATYEESSDPHPTEFASGVVPIEADLGARARVALAADAADTEPNLDDFYPEDGQVPPWQTKLAPAAEEE